MDATDDLTRTARFASSPASSGTRFIHLDALRGALLFVMAVNHIPSDLRVATDHVFGFVSAAEGFVFMAGLMAGLVYARRWLRGGREQVASALGRRALLLYTYHVAVYGVVLCWLFGYTMQTGVPPTNMPPAVAASPLLAFLAGPLLIYQPALFDVLPMYCGFLLLTTPLLQALEDGRRRQVWAGSAMAWVVTNALCPQLPLIQGFLHMGAFNLGAWQFLFVSGMIFGHAWARGESLLPAPRAGVISLFFVAEAFLYMLRHGYLPAGFSAETFEWLINKNNLAPLRLLNDVVLFYLVYLCVSRFPRLFAWKPLAFLGRHSAFVFACHVFVAYFVQGQPGLFAETAAARWLGTAIVVGSLFAAAAVHEYLRTAGRADLPVREPLRTRQSAQRRAEVRDAEREVSPANSLHS